MSRIDGARGIAYMAIASGAPASPVAFVSDWTVAVACERIDVTGLNDPQRVWIAGLQEFTGGFDGWYDDATSQTYIAATDGVPRNFYLYPDPRDNPGGCFYGMILPDFSVAAGVQAAASVKCSWSAAGVILRSPAFAGILQDEAYIDILDEAYGVLS